MKTYRVEKTIPPDRKLILEALPFQSEEVVEVVIRTKKILSKSPKKSSKWAKIVERIQNDPVHPAGYSGQLKKDMREFRESFE
ncbi:MAG: hypothetical protein AB7S75_12830 [Desulfococcaceae bacterium]